MINFVISPAYRNKISREILDRAVAEVLKDQSTHGESDFSIVIAGDKKIRQLNLEYREIDSATDVLSFPDGEDDPETGKPYLGDIVISYPFARKQAEEEGHSLNEELQLLVVHGMLHLMGYDHASTGEKQEMWAVQSRILRRLGVKINI